MKELASEDPSRREAAMKAITLFGPNKSYEAVPAIIAWMNKHKPPNDPIDLSMRVNGIIALSTIFKQTWATNFSSAKERPRIRRRR